MPDDVYSTYNFNFDATSPEPPMMSPSVRILAGLMLACNCVSFLLSSTVLLLIRRRKLQDTYSAVVILLSWEVAYSVHSFIVISSSLHYGRVPSMAMCQYSGFGYHLLCSCEISSLVGLAYDRYHKVKSLTRSGAAAAKTRREESPHWLYVRRVVWPLLAAFAALPIVTNSRFGVFGVKNSSELCFSMGGAGILLHDIYVALLAMYFYGLVVPSILYFLILTHRMLNKLLRNAKSSSGDSAASTQQLAGSQKAAKIERQALLFAVALIFNVLAAWSATGVHLILLPFRISADWPPMFFAFIALQPAM